MKYRKKPLIVEAIQWTGGNLQEIIYSFPECFGSVVVHHSSEIVIRTLEGNMVAIVGDYIVKGIKGEFYPCKPNIFEDSYEKVNEMEIENPARTEQIASLYGHYYKGNKR